MSKEPIIRLPDNWTAEQVLVVHDLLTDLAEVIWQHYETTIIESLHGDHEQTNRQADLFEFDDWPIPF